MTICIAILSIVGCNTKQQNAPVTVKNKTKQETQYAANATMLYKAIEALFSNGAATKQMFVVSAKENTTITAKGGFTVNLNTKSLCKENSTALSDEKLHVTIQEILSTDALLAANATTISDGKLLISGGSYFIDIQQNSLPVKIKAASNLTIKVPKLKQKGMSLFYGNKTSDGFVNWESTTTTFTEPIKLKRSNYSYTKSDLIQTGDSIGTRPATLAECIKIHHDSTMKARLAYTIANRDKLTYKQEMAYGLRKIDFPMERFIQKKLKSDSGFIKFNSCFAFRKNESLLNSVSSMYMVQDTFPIYREKYETININQQTVLEYCEPVEIQKLGWINVDKFYDIPVCDSTSFVWNDNIKLQNAKIYFKFLNINSVLAETKNNINVSNFQTFSKLPLNQQVEAIIIGVSNNIVYTAKSRFFVKPKNRIPIQLLQINKTIAML